MGLSLNVLRTGKKYRLINHGESHDFVVENVLENGDFRVKDLITLESFYLRELIQYGLGQDYDLQEIEKNP
jgi:hypothetical protein